MPSLRCGSPGTRAARGGQLSGAGLLRSVIRYPRSASTRTGSSPAPPDSRLNTCLAICPETGFHHPPGPIGSWRLVDMTRSTPREHSDSTRTPCDQALSGVPDAPRRLSPAGAQLLGAAVLPPCGDGAEQREQAGMSAGRCRGGPLNRPDEDRRIAHSPLLAKYVERLMSQKDGSTSEYPPSPGAF